MSKVIEKNVSFKELNHTFDIIENSFRKFAERPAFSCLGQTLTFSEIDQKSKALAVYFQQNTDLQIGDRVALVLPNLIQFPIAAYAVLRAGLILVNTNPLYTINEMSHQFVDAQVKAVIVLTELVPKLKAVIAKTSISTIIVTQASDLLSSLPSFNLQEINDDLNNAVERDINIIAFNQAISKGLNGELKPCGNTDLDDTVVLQYTGGTTGLSKGAMLTHKNLLANVQQAGQRFDTVSTDGQDIYICPLPLYHIYAFLVNLLLAASKGALNVLIPNPRDLSAFVEAITPYKFTIFTGINTLFVGLCHHEGFKSLDFSSLKLTMSGGSALTKNAADLWYNTTQCQISEGYGLSETSPVLTFNTPGQEKLGTIGWPLVDTIIEIWNDDNQPVSLGESGEIVAKGPQVMKGYWRQEQATKEAIINGFFKTGDIGCIEEDGRIKIVDRKKDMILVSGFNVYPNEVENVLSQHPKIIESAVIGVNDEHTGEKVCAFVVKELNENVSVDEIITFCREHLASYKIPKQIVFLTELPKSTVGKVLRRELR